MIAAAWRAYRFLARLLAELQDDRPRISRACLEAALRRQDMDRHPVEREDHEPHAALGVPLRPGDVRKAPVFERNGRK